MKAIFCSLILAASWTFAASPTDGIYLIVRADDIGSSHAANLACIESYQQGIARSVEVMVPCPWFLEAAAMLRDNPGYDVGVHLTLTSEWSNVKWRPLTCAPSLVDSNGYFYPKAKIWSDENSHDAFYDARPDIEQVEAELRAQIEMALKHIAQVSHLSSHMGVTGLDDELRALEKRLAEEYDLDIDLSGLGATYGRWGSDTQDDAATREQKLIDMLEAQQNGLTVIIEHPGLDTPEMRGHGHPGYEHVAAHRHGVTKAFTSEKVKQVIQKRNIQLISYKQAQELFGK
ncbi:polysaccharide deacetylase family protein [candidate division KSB1 bacterium]|nr:polysaccharide deacetylase family protein [candidate division KSB1 bacterium]